MCGGGDTAEAEVGVPSAENPEAIEGSLLKPVVSQTVALHALFPARDNFFLISAFPVQSTSFYPKPLPI